MKKFLLLPVMFILLTALVMPGCASTPVPQPTVVPSPSPVSKPAPAPSAAPAPAAKPAPAPSAPAKPGRIELRVASNQIPSQPSYTGVLLPFKQEVEQRSNGRLLITLYHSDSLSKAQDISDAVKSGVADYGLIMTTVYKPDYFPLSQVMSLPLGAPNAAVGAQVLNALYEQFPEIQKEFTGWKFFSFVAMNPTMFHTKKKAIRTFADLKGVKMRSMGGVDAEAAKALGIVPVALGMAEIPMAIERGLVEGAIIPYGPVITWKIYEQVNHHTEVFMGQAQSATAMNLKSWNDLPADLQAIVAEASKKAALNWNEVMDKMELDGRADIQKKGHGIYTFSPEDMAKASDALAPIMKKWASDMDARGLPGAKIVAAREQLLKKFATK